MNEGVFAVLNGLAGQSVALDALIIFTAVWLPWVLIVGVAFFLFRERFTHPQLFFMPSRTHARELGILFCTALVAWILAQVFKDFFGAPRPFEVLQQMHPLISKSGMDSFPSGHATFFSALALGLYWYHRKLGYLYFTGALAVGLARIIAGVHFPVDILGGYLLGCLVALGVHCLLANKKAA